MNGDDRCLLSVRNARKVFKLGGRVLGSKLVAVSDASFSMDADRPEIITLAGESGSGKTTLARMILGLTDPTSGEINILGQNTTMIRNRRETLSFMGQVQPVFQNPFESFNPLKKVERYLFQTARTHRNVESQAQTEEVVDESLRAIGLSFEEVKGRFPNEFSGGQLQRISIARALISRSKLLVADEPVSMVDASTRMSIMNLFIRLKQEFNLGIVYITHDLATAYYISDRIAIMFRGDVIESGTVDQVVLNPVHPYTRTLVSSIPTSDPDERWTDRIKLSTLEAKEFARMGCKYADRCPWATEHCRTEVPAERTVAGRMVRCHRAEEILESEGTLPGSKEHPEA